MNWSNPVPLYALTAPGENMRTFFLTPNSRLVAKGLEVELANLGLTAQVEPARVLPSRSLAVEVYGELQSLHVGSVTILRVDVSNPPVKIRRMLEKIRGVAHVRATLEHAPAGQDLAGALRSLPPRLPPHKTPAGPYLGRRKIVWVVSPATTRPKFFGEVKSVSKKFTENPEATGFARNTRWVLRAWFETAADAAAAHERWGGTLKR